MVAASVRWTGEMMFSGTGNAGSVIQMDGDGKAGNSPTELVLIALCGCTAYDVVNILQKKREPLRTLNVSAEAEKAPNPPRVYTSIKLKYHATGKIARKAIEDAVRLSEEKYCSVAAMLSKTAKITYEIQLDAD